ncbi:MAG TPA: hypothetical protein DCW90_07180 [Lachnospiraceae bacterium]|nr:hypothetical protein [Lachnospiraceae bacterium]
MATKKIDVVDLVLQDGINYKPAVLRSYARYSYMPDGTSVYNYILALENRIQLLEAGGGGSGGGGTIDPSNTYIMNGGNTRQ